MTDARGVVLQRIRAALGSSAAPSMADHRSQPPSPEQAGEPWPSRIMDAEGASEHLRLLQDRLLDYRAGVFRCSPADLGNVINSRLEARAIRSLAVPRDLPPTWTAGLQDTGPVLLRDSYSEPLRTETLDSVQGVLTGCALAIAETGTLVLDGGPAQGRRALTLLPDYHLCVVSAHQVVGSMPEAWDLLGESTRGRRPLLTLVSGPSATSDIELIRVEGVHGPRTLDVILVGER